MKLRKVKKYNNGSCNECEFNNREKYSFNYCISLTDDGKLPKCSDLGAHLIFKKVKKWREDNALNALLGFAIMILAGMGVIHGLTLIWRWLCLTMK